LLRKNTHPDIKKLVINNNKPLIVCDADEVIFDFMSTFEIFLKSNNLYFNWKSYALNGNILNKNKIAIKDKEVKNILKAFFSEKTLSMPLIFGAKKSLEKLSKKYSIIILSNIPHEFYNARKQALNSHNIKFPFFSNKGPKGKTVEFLANGITKNIWFIDDSPHQIKSVKNYNENINTILFVNNLKLKRLINHRICWDFFSSKWQTNVNILLN